MVKVEKIGQMAVTMLVVALVGTALCKGVMVLSDNVAAADQTINTPTLPGRVPVVTTDAADAADAPLPD